MTYKEFKRIERLVTVLDNRSERPFIDFLMQTKEFGGYEKVGNINSDFDRFDYVVLGNTVFSFGSEGGFIVSEGFVNIFDDKYIEEFGGSINTKQYQYEKSLFIDDYIIGYLGLGNFSEKHHRI